MIALISITATAISWTKAFFCAMVFITSLMKQQGSKTALFWCRAVIFAGALLCVCVSDSTGPRLLPLPAASLSLASSTFLSESGACASRTPNRNKDSNSYLQMVSGSRYRARERHHEMNAATYAPEAFCQPTPVILATATQIYAPLNFRTAPISIPSGRAPPRFA